VYEYELKIGWGKSVALPSQALPAPPPGQMAIRSKEVCYGFLPKPIVQIRLIYVHAVFASCELLIYIWYMDMHTNVILRDRFSCAQKNLANAFSFNIL
jgi:hypothetical protein